MLELASHFLECSLDWFKSHTTLENTINLQHVKYTRQKKRNNIEFLVGFISKKCI